MFCSLNYIKSSFFYRLFVRIDKNEGSRPKPHERQVMAETRMKKGEHGIVSKVNGDWICRRRLSEETPGRQQIDGPFLVLCRRHWRDLER
jgi:hypothetical protein